MKVSNPFKEMIPDLIKAQMELRPVFKKGKNPHFQSDYAEYQDVIEEIKKCLNKYNMFITHAAHFESDKLIMETLVFHTSGEWLSTELPLINKAGTDQGLGSSITYTKRYSAEALLGVSTTIDDDGNAATDNKDNDKKGDSGGYDPAEYFEGHPPDLEIEDETFQIGVNTGKKFSSKLSDTKYLTWVKDQVTKNLAKTHPQMRRFYEFTKSKGATT